MQTHHNAQDMYDFEYKLNWILPHCLNLAAEKSTLTVRNQYQKIFNRRKSLEKKNNNKYVRGIMKNAQLHLYVNGH